MGKLRMPPPTGMHGDAVQVSALTALTRLTQLQLVYTSRKSEHSQAVGGLDRTLDQVGMLAHMTWLTHLTVIDGGYACGVYPYDTCPHLDNPSLLGVLPAWVWAWGPGLAHLVLTGVDLDKGGTAAVLQGCQQLVR